jgi:hypothetical protein
MEQKRPTHARSRVLKQKTIGLRLTAAELEHVQGLAMAEQRSLSSMARLLLLKGLEAAFHEHKEKPHVPSIRQQQYRD